MALKQTAVNIFLIVIILITLSSIHAEDEDDRKTDKWKIIPIPGVAYTEDTGFLIALAFTAFEDTDPLYADKNSDTYAVSARYSLENMYGLSFSAKNYLADDTQKLSYKANLSKSIDDFYGIGINTEKSSAEKYKSSVFNAAFTWLFKNGSFYTGPEFLFYNDKVSEKEKLLSSGIFYGSEGITQIGSGIIIEYDTRDSKTYPGSGVYYTFKWNTYSNSFLSDYSYNYFKTDLSSYCSITEGHIIALNAVYELASGDVPFQMLPSLGGSSILRGFSSDRYRDRQFTGIQGEYRFPVRGFLSAVLFAGTGTVFDDFEDLSMEYIKSAAGGGLRFNLSKKQKINIRLDYARSSDSENKFILSFMEAF